MNDELEASSTTTVTTTTGPTSAVTDAASLIAAVATLVAGSTSTIMARLDENARGASERWRLHDEELERNRALITRKFDKIENELAAEIIRVEKALEAHLIVADAHFAREHDEDLVMRARIQPVRTAGAWIIANWKTVVLIVGLVLGWVLLGVESIEHILP